MATGDILSVTITDKTTAGQSTDGWFADVVIEGLSTGGSYSWGLGTNNDPSSAKFVMTVVSKGFDASGNATTITRTLWGVKTLRKAYNQQASLQETASGGNVTIRVALAEYGPAVVYAKDKTGAGNSGTDPTVSIAAGWYTQGGTPNNACTNLAVTNNSTAAYQKPIFQWTTVPYQRVTGDFSVELVGGGHGARNKKPLACVAFDAVDAHSHSAAQQVVTDMTVSTLPSASATKVLSYKATIPVTGFTSGDAITIRARAYPWIGDVILDSDTGADGTAQPSELMGPLVMLYDSGSSIPTTYAVVDGTNGSDVTGAAAASYAAAALTPCKTLGKGVEAIQAFNNTTYSRNTADNGDVSVLAGNYAMPGSTMSGANTTAWCVIHPDQSTNKAGVSITSGGNTSASAYIKFQSITFTGNSTGQVRGNSTAIFWFDDCDINMTGTAPIYQSKYFVATRCNFTALAGGLTAFSTTHGPWKLVYGCHFIGQIGADLYALIGNDGKMQTIFNQTGNVSGAAISDGAVCAFNAVYDLTSPFTGGSNGWASSTVLTKGILFVQNVIEAGAIGGQPLVQICADGDTSASANVIMWHNTLAGERINRGYNETGTSAVIRTGYFEVGNIFNNRNVKTDTFTGTPNGARIGNWEMVNGIGQYSNIIQGELFAQDFAGLLTNTSAAPHYLNSASNDYHLDTGSDAFNAIPAGFAVLPFDLDGNARSNSGNGAAGAYAQSGEAASGAVHLAGERLVGEALVCGGLVP